MILNFLTFGQQNLLPGWRIILFLFEGNQIIMEDKVSPIVSPAEALKRSPVIIIDARGGGNAYDRYVKGHIGNALYVDLDRDLSQKTEDPAYGGRHPLPSMENFGKLLGKLGISPAMHVLVYDDKGGANAAARFWWMMKSIGHKNIQVVDGGLDGLVRAGAKLTTEIPDSPSTKDYPAEAWQLPTASILNVEQASLTKNALIFDVREGYRYRGESEPIDLIAGHIPGALNVPYTENLDSDGAFCTPEELKVKFQKLIGATKPENVIVHCGSGVTACHTLLAMDYAGMAGSKLYVGSWSEWSRREKSIVVEAKNK
jgi:thiosulfate/3-mercaptopyruvate sulfurtransferase